jgi:hypothetical protein
VTLINISLESISLNTHVSLTWKCFWLVSSFQQMSTVGIGD